MNEVHFITYMTFHCFRLSLMLETTLHNPLASGTVGGGRLGDYFGSLLLLGSNFIVLFLEKKS